MTTLSHHEVAGKLRCIDILSGENTLFFVIACMSHNNFGICKLAKIGFAFLRKANMANFVSDTLDWIGMKMDSFAIKQCA